MSLLSPFFCCVLVTQCWIEETFCFFVVFGLKFCYCFCFLLLVGWCFSLGSYHMALLNPKKVKARFECIFLVVLIVHCIISCDIFECNIINDFETNL